ncbi:MAG TPA: filamentous hemagglutinin N-terminal domain-containing protein, partial [Candidatus Methylacidiphilales bacterium]
MGIFTGLSLTPWELHGQNVLPTNPNVVNGTATFSTTDGAMQVVNSNGASIHWDSFSIGAHNSVYFQQSGSDSTVLNTVVGHNLSEIYGSLGSNGKVFLINQNGIFIGANATINTAGFLASTLNINNAEFKANNGAGTLHFVGKSDASITNLGTINAIGGDVYLIAKHVSNSGTITASEVNGKGGIVGMYATHELYLTTGAPDGGLVRLGSGSKSVGTGTGIDNSGVINAVQADLKATGNLYSLAINNSGVIRATGATVKNGVIHLSAPGGTISSSGTLRAVNANGDGGTIKVQSGSGGTTLVSGTVDASASTAVTQVWLNPSLLAPPGLPSDGFQTLTLGGVTVGTMALDANGNAYSPQKGGNVELSGDYVAVYDSAKVKADGPAGGGTIAIGGS